MARVTKRAAVFHHSLSPRRLLSPCSGASTVCHHGAFCHLAAAPAPFVTTAPFVTLQRRQHRLSPRRLFSFVTLQRRLHHLSPCHHGAFCHLAAAPAPFVTMPPRRLLSPCSGASTICHHVTTAPFATLQRRLHHLSPCHQNRAAIVPF